ncbi:MAG: MFS transporter [Syntrophales bacterium]|nr:MFS transporter [Syntrophales bacterium]MDD4339764.1 MFS transporter [Syntrophales bacterium]HOG08028.1 MFS transporter [Syntrophales bacterium]HOS77265.1 MFS transporter [Syntrophales bacterium]HPB70556.1 MFS transporter [Syntrophales bacterium]
MTSERKIFYGWWIVGGAFFLNFAGIGIIMNTMGVFIKPVTESLGFTRGGFTLYFTIAALSMMVMAPVMGKLLERYNIRLIMTVCTAMMATSFALFSQCRTLTQFYIVAVFLGIGSAGSHIIPVSMMITNWFIDKRGLAMGIVFAATGVGGMIFNPLANWIILNHSWQAAFLTFGLVIGLASIPTALFIVRAKPADMGLLPYGGEAALARQSAAEQGGLTATKAFRTGAFWLLALIILLIAVANMGVLHHIVPYLTDLGFSSTTATTLMSLHMAMLIFGKVLAGSLADRLGLLKSYLILMVGLMVSIALLYGSQWMWVAVVFNILFGFSIAVRTVLPPLMTARVLGQKHFAVIYGFLNIFTTLGTAVGVPLSGFIYDATKSYYLAFALYIGLCLITTAAGIAVLTRSGKK